MSIKQRIGEYLLNKKLKNRPKRTMKFSGIDGAKKIGIIFDATQIDDYKMVKQFERELREMGNKVTYLGYSQSKAMPEQYVNDLKSGFINKKDFNWYFNCKSRFAIDFTDNALDLLIVLTHKDLFPIHYLTTLSKAGFKVGRSGVYKDDFDLIMEMPEELAFNLQIENIKHYLQLISRPSQPAEV